MLMFHSAKWRTGAFLGVSHAPYPKGMGGCTGVSGLTRGLATLPQGGSRSLQWLEKGMEDPQEEPLAVLLLSV